MTAARSLYDPYQRCYATALCAKAAQSQNYRASLGGRVGVCCTSAIISLLTLLNRGVAT